MTENIIRDGNDLIRNMYLSNAFTIQQISKLCGLTPYLVRKVLFDVYNIKQNRTGTRVKTTDGFPKRELNRIVRGLIKYYGTNKRDIDKVVHNLKRPLSND